MLKLYDEKKNKDKISAIISEMKRYKGIKLLSGRFGEDNRDWLVNKETATISQSISSIRFMSKDAAEDLYRLGLQNEAEMGVEVTAGILSPEAKKNISVVKKKLKEFKAIYDTPETAAMSANELNALRARKEAIVKEGTELEKLINEIKADPASYSEQAKENRIMAKLDCFTNVLRAIQMNAPAVNTRMIKILISLDYFHQFGKTGKLMKIFDEFFEGEKALTKTIKSFNKRLEYMREFEASLPDEDLPTGLRLQMEYDNVGLCLSVDPSAPSLLYFVESVESKYGVKAKLYSVKRGKTGLVKIPRKIYDKDPFLAGFCVLVDKIEESQRYAYKNGKKVPVPGETDFWINNYSIEYEQRQDIA